MSKSADVAKVLSGPVGYLVVGAVVIGAGYLLFTHFEEELAKWWNDLKNKATTAVKNTAQPISTDGGSYTGADGVPSTPNETDVLTALNFGNLGA